MRMSTLEVLRDYAATNPAGERVVPIELEDMTSEELDRFVSDCMTLRPAVNYLQKAAKEIILARDGEPDRTGTRHAARFGTRVYIHDEQPSDTVWVDERRVLEFLFDRGGAVAVLKAHRKLTPRSPQSLRPVVEDIGVEWGTFADTFLTERVRDPQVKLIDLSSSYAPKWAHGLDDRLDAEEDCG